VALADCSEAAVLTMDQLFFHLAMAPGALVALKTGIVIPLGAACMVLIVLIPSAAWRGRMSVPIYALMALATGITALAAGHLAGAQTVRGTPLGVVISIVFFLLVAAGFGCFLGILFYRQPPQDDESAAASGEGTPASSSSGDPTH